MKKIFGIKCKFKNLSKRWKIAVGTAIGMSVLFLCIAFFLISKTHDTYSDIDIITMGLWPNSEYARPIEWINISRNFPSCANGEKKALLLSRNVIDFKPYNHKGNETTWETSSLRKWLNNDFYNAAFTPSEKQAIYNRVLIKNPSANIQFNKAYLDDLKKCGKYKKGDEKNLGSEYYTLGGKDTIDKVWILSPEELKKSLLSSEKKRQAKPMEYLGKNNYCVSTGCSKGDRNYCDSKECKKNNMEGTSWYWLRSPGKARWAASNISYSGFINSIGDDVAKEDGGVRPVLYVDIDVLKQTVNDRREKFAAIILKAIKNSSADKYLKITDNKTVLFGSYPYNEDGTSKPIEWQILDRIGTKVLLISRYAIDYKKYNEKKRKVTWENSTIRKWLNKEFKDKAFTLEEQKFIADSRIENKDNSKTGTKGGNDTQDKVFLLSTDEAQLYFAAGYYCGGENGKAYPTPYSASRLFGLGIEVDESVKWWLRTPGKKQYEAAFVYSSGALLSWGIEVSFSNYVRPAIWVDFSK